MSSTTESSVSGRGSVVARISAFVVGAVAMALAIVLQTANMAFLVALALRSGASRSASDRDAHFLAKVRCRRARCAGLAGGILGSIGLILVRPSVMGVEFTTVVGQQHDSGRGFVPAGESRHPGAFHQIIGAILGTLLATTSSRNFRRSCSSAPIPASERKGRVHTRTEVKYIQSG